MTRAPRVLALVVLPVLAYSQTNVIRHPDHQRLTRILDKLMKKEQITKEELAFSIKMLSSDVAVWRMRANLVLRFLVSQKRMSMAEFTRHHVVACANADGKLAGTTVHTYISWFPDIKLTREVGANVRRKDAFHSANTRVKLWPEQLQGSRSQMVRALCEILAANQWDRNAQRLTLDALNKTVKRVKGAEKELVQFTISVVSRKVISVKRSSAVPRTLVQFSW